MISRFVDVLSAKNNFLVLTVFKVIIEYSFIGDRHCQTVLLTLGLDVIEDFI